MKQRLLAILLVLCMVVAFIPVMAVASAAEDTGTTGVTGTTDTWDWSADKTDDKLFVQPTNGTGTAEDPILIESAAQFMWFRNKLTDKTGLTLCYKLMVNIHFKSPAEIATDKETQNAYRSALGAPATVTYTTKNRKDVFTYKPFSGVFDGNGKVIDGFCPSQFKYQGLFGIVSGTVKGLTVCDSNVDTGTTNSFGFLCYQVSGGTVENCHVKNTTVTGGILGGIAASVNKKGIVRNCTAGNVKLMISSGSAGPSAGLIAGVLSTGTVEGCTAEGSVEGNSHTNKKGIGHIGGIVGVCDLKDLNTIQDCVSNVQLTGGTDDKQITQYPNVGGIVGSVDYAGGVNMTISNCRSEGTITVYNAGNAGGIIGLLSSPREVKLDDCQSKCNITAVANAGGIIGQARGSTNDNGVGPTTMNRCRNSGKIVATGDNVGGLIGFCQQRMGRLTVTESANEGNVAGANYVGGFIGSTQTTPNGKNINALAFTNCALNAQVIATGNYAGLVIGCRKVLQDTATLNIENCVLLGQVSAAGNAAAIAGSVGTDATTPIATPTVTLTNAYVQATVTVDAGGKAGTIAGGATEEAITGMTLTITGSKFAIQVVIGDNTEETPNAYYNYAGDGTAVALDALDAADLTNGTAVDVLNTGLETAAWVQGTNNPELKLFYVAPETPEGVSIPVDGASLTIGNSVTLNLFVNKATVDAANVSFTKIYVVSEKGRYEGTLRTEDNKYVFEIKGLTAKEFGENKEYTVQLETADGPVTSTAVKAYSPLQYAINMYGKRTDMATLDPLLLAIVNYAEAAGANAKNVFNPAVFGENIEKTETAWGMKLPGYATVLAEDTNAERYTYTGSLPKFGATLSETLTLTATLGTTYTDLTVKIGNTTVSGEVTDGKVTVSGLYATDLYNTMVLTYTLANGETASYTWSLMQYLDSFKGTDDAALAEATAIYLYAARAFCIANHN